jgi:predicted AlkP superfamily pyrophosphatase or phosphodiesterase
MTRFCRAFVGSVLVLFLGAPATLPAQAAARPRLVVVISIDQFRADYLQRFSKYFGSGGFNLLLRQGANFTQAYYQHSVTQTCPGHAVILTGSYADRNGIVANTWFDTASHKAEYCSADTAARLIGVGSEGRSPRNLLVSTVGDELKEATKGRSRVITVAGKDRSAIMLGGHDADAAYWTEDTLFVSSTYYMKELPGWVQRFNTSGEVSKYQGLVWDRLLPASDYAMVGPDDVAAEREAGGMGRTFPHLLGQIRSSSATFLEGFQTSPFENELIVDFAIKAITEESLGQDDAPDLLGIGFSANDLVGHSYGPDSHEMMDITIRTDRLLQRFFGFLAERIGLEHVAIVLTSDHGVPSLPEVRHMRDPGATGGRIDPAVIAGAAEQALRAQYGTPRRPGFVDQPTWIIYQGWPWLYLNREALRDRRIDIAEAERIAQRAVQRVPGVVRALTATELQRERASNSRTREELSFYPPRSGNVYYELAPYLVPEAKPQGTTHGAPWEYDTHVPMLWLSSGIRPGNYGHSVGVADLAPTLSALLGIPPPSASQGRVLKEMLP